MYASWGLGVSTAYHLLNPWTQMGIRKLGTNENIWGREVDPSANRWQVGGCWATDESELIPFLDLNLGVSFLKSTAASLRGWKGFGKSQ